MCWRSPFVLCLLNLPKCSSFKSLPLILLWIKPSTHIFQHGSSLSLKNVCDSCCMYQTGLFGSAAVIPQNKFTELCSSAEVVPESKLNLSTFVAWRPLFHKVNLPRCEARRRHFMMTCDIFCTGQTNILALYYLFGKTYKPAHSSSSSRFQYRTKRFGSSFFPAMAKIN